ncbi:unnamed protein product [Rotaria magnacalcarata]|nr:unnamed protein product [Rotaria magnacalcarata]
MLNSSDDFSYLRDQLLTTSTDTTYDTITKRSTADKTHDKTVKNQLPQPTNDNELTTRKRPIIHFIDDMKNDSRTMTDVFMDRGSTLLIEHRS